MKDEYFEKTEKLVKDLEKYIAYITYLDEQGNPKVDIMYNAAAQCLYEIGWRKENKEN